MNPAGADQQGAGEYLGSEPLDPALADRFAIVVQVGDWAELSEEQQRLVAHPGGEGRVSDDGGGLRADVAVWREAFLAALPQCPAAIVDYARIVTGELGAAGVRLSPRRARLIARSLLAASVIEQDTVEASFRTILECSLPQRASGEAPPAAKIAAAHRLAWDASLATGERQWLVAFHLQRALPEKLRLLAETCPDPDTGTLAVEQLLAHESSERAAAFALAAYPAALAGALTVGAEGVADLGRLAQRTAHGRRRAQMAGAPAGARHHAPRAHALLAGARGPRGAAPRARAPALLLGAAAEGAAREARGTGAGVRRRRAVPRREAAVMSPVGSASAEHSSRTRNRPAEAGPTLGRGPEPLQHRRPRSRTRTQHIRATVLGAGDGPLSCPLVIRVALDFGKRDPLVAVEALLRRARIREPEALRERFALPAEPCICREWREPVPLSVAEASRDEVLAQVLLLALCTPHHFDPRRPVLLTRASLTRRLELFAGRGFYA